MAKKKHKASKIQEDLTDEIEKFDSEYTRRSMRIKKAKRISLSDNLNATEEEKVLINAGRECHGENCVGEASWRSHLNGEPRGYWCSDCKNTSIKFGGETSPSTTWEELEMGHYIEIIQSEEPEEL